MNEIEKIVSLVAEIEIGEMDADIVGNLEEANYYYKEYLPSLYKELHINYVKLLKTLGKIHKHSEYKYQLEFANN